MKDLVVKFIGIIVIMAIFSWLIYPTPYRYFQLERNIIKVNTISGEAYILDFNKGWVKTTK